MGIAHPPVEVHKITMPNVMLGFRFNLTCFERSLLRKKARGCFCEAPLCQSNLGRFSQDVGTFPLPSFRSPRIIQIAGSAAEHENGAFAALNEDGAVVTWGHLNHGGDFSGITQLVAGNSGIQPYHIKHIYSNDLGFAAITPNG